MPGFSEKFLVTSILQRSADHEGCGKCQNGVELWEYGQNQRTTKNIMA